MATPQGYSREHQGMWKYTLEEGVTGFSIHGHVVGELGAADDTMHVIEYILMAVTVSIVVLVTALVIAHLIAVKPYMRR